MKWFEKIRIRREELGLSQSQLARDLNLSQATIHKIESGSVARSRFIGRFSKRLNIPLSELDTDFDNGFAVHEFLNGPNIDNLPRESRLFSDHYLEDIRGSTPVFKCSDDGKGNLWLENGTVGHINKPDYMSDLKDVIAVLIDFDKMSPELERGDIAILCKGFQTLLDTSGMFISKIYQTPSSRMCKFGRIMSTSDNGWAIKVWNTSSRSEDLEALEVSGWFSEYRVLAKYYGAFDLARIGSASP